MLDKILLLLMVAGALGLVLNLFGILALSTQFSGLCITLVCVSFLIFFFRRRRAVQTEK